MSAAALGWLLSGLVLAGCGAGAATSSRPAVPSSAIGTRLDKALPTSLFHLPLVDAAGRPAPISSYRGKVLVISDMMTLCQETCPIDTATVVQTARAVQRAGLGDDVEFLSITVDPARDTVAQVSAYRKLFRPAPADWAVLTGPRGAITRLWNTLGVYRQTVPEGTPPAENWRTGTTLTYDIQHSDEVFFVDPDFHERFVLEGPPHLSDTAALPGRLRRFLDGQGRRNLDHPAATSWTKGQALQVLSWLLGERVRG